MAKKKASKQNIQLIIMLAFFAFFILWAMSKCNNMKEDYREKSAAETIEEEQGSAISQQADTPRVVPEVRTIKERYMPLYVTIDGMNLRDKPQLNGKILNRLELHEEVVFLNEVTDSIWEIKLGLVTTQEPWVKVKCKKGHTGWVYGAGVSYYKKELKIE